MKEFTSFVFISKHGHIVASIKCWHSHILKVLCWQIQQYSALFKNSWKWVVCKEWYTHANQMVHQLFALGSC